MSYLVEDLLVAARATMSDLSIVPADMEVCSEVREAIGAITDPAAKTIDCVSDGELVVWSDPLRVRQIVRNLVSNAIKHGGGDVEVSVRATEGWAVIAVSDRGARLSREQVVEIFEPYSRGPGPTVTGSVGLGLSVARLLALRLGGDLQYQHDGGRNVFVLKLSMPYVAGRAGSTEQVVG